MADVFIRMPQLQEDFGNPAKSTIYNWVREGLLPPAVLIGQQSKAWPRREIDRVREARIAGKSPVEIKTLVAELVAARSRPAEAA